MKIQATIAIAAVTLAFAGLTPAQADNEQATEVAETEVEANADAIVCRRLQPRVGTRIGGRRVCKTEREWDQLRRGSQREADQAAQRGTAHIPHGNGRED